MQKNSLGSHANEESFKDLADATSLTINADASNGKSIKLTRFRFNFFFHFMNLVQIQLLHVRSVMDETSETIAKADQNSVQYREENCQLFR